MHLLSSFFFDLLLNILLFTFILTTCAVHSLFSLSQELCKLLGLGVSWNWLNDLSSGPSTADSAMTTSLLLSYRHPWRIGTCRPTHFPLLILIISSSGKALPHLCRSSSWSTSKTVSWFVFFLTFIQVSIGILINQSWRLWKETLLLFGRSFSFCSFCGCLLLFLLLLLQPKHFWRPIKDITIAEHVFWVLVSQATHLVAKRSWVGLGSATCIQWLLGEVGCLLRCGSACRLTTGRWFAEGRQVIFRFFRIGLTAPLHYIGSIALETLLGHPLSAQFSLHVFLLPSWHCSVHRLLCIRTVSYHSGW